MNTKTFRMLSLLDEQIQKCKECNLYENGRAKLYWTKNSKYMGIVEAPGKDEVELNQPLVGKTGHMFWEMIEPLGLYKEDFLIINSVNCRSMKGNKNLIPSEYHRNQCRPWIKKYIKVFQPNKIILMGNASIHTITGMWGVTKLVGITEDMNVFDNDVKLIYCYHPSSVIYDQKKKNDIIECVKMLKE